jgi:hypothetical protein
VSVALAAILLAPPIEEAPEREWYGWQTATVDLAACGLFLGGALADESLPRAFGSVLYVAGGPVLHAAHGSLGQALASLGIRLVLPLLGSLITLAAHEGTEVGLVAGAIPAAAFDAIALAWR